MLLPPKVPAAEGSLRVLFLSILIRLVALLVGILVQIRGTKFQSKRIRGGGRSSSSNRTFLFRGGSIVPR
jgi:hypothetical protein